MGTVVALLQKDSHARKKHCRNQFLSSGAILSLCKHVFFNSISGKLLATSNSGRGLFTIPFDISRSNGLIFKI